MKPSRARAWLDDILAGLEPDSAALDRLIDECGTENLHHDYKSGAELANADKGGRTLRKYTTGFANADGGMLLVGVGNDQGHTIDGCPRPGGKALPEWAARSLASQVPYFSPQPRMFVVPYVGPRLTSSAGPAEVLIIAVERSPVLVPCVEGARQVFYFRIGDSTVAAPDYLLADMILGRRSHPAFEIHSLRFHKWSAVPDESSVTGSFTPARQLILNLEIENRSLVFAEHVRGGLLTWILATGLDRSAPKYLLPSVTVRQPPTQYPHDTKWKHHWLLAHLSIFNTQGGAPVHLGAFERSPMHRVVELALPVPNDVWAQFGVPHTPADSSDPVAVQRYQASLRGRARLDAALYVVARGSTPTWFQVTVRYRAGTTAVVEPLEPGGLELERVGTGSPVVSWDYDV